MTTSSFGIRLPDKTWLHILFGNSSDRLPTELTQSENPIGWIDTHKSAMDLRPAPHNDATQKVGVAPDGSSVPLRRPRLEAKGAMESDGIRTRDKYLFGFGGWLQHAGESQAKDVRTLPTSKRKGRGLGTTTLRPAWNNCQASERLAEATGFEPAISISLD
jgi:hypothetical protein